MKETTIDDIPEQYRHIAALIGIQQLIVLADEKGGTDFYLPKVEALTRARKAKVIAAEYNGHNILELAQKYSLTERWVREICNAKPMVGQLSFIDVVSEPGDP